MPPPEPRSNHPNRGKGPKACAWCATEAPRLAPAPFCSVGCAIRYARAAFKAGFRAPPQKPEDPNADV